MGCEALSNAMKARSGRSLALLGLQGVGLLKTIDPYASTSEEYGHINIPVNPLPGVETDAFTG